jgi:hypothetical protein
VHPQHYDDDFADVLAGVAAIAAYIKKTPRQTNYLLATGTIPGRKVGAIWHSTKRELRVRFMGEDGSA